MSIQLNGEMDLKEELRQKDEEIRQLNESLGDLELYLRELNALIPLPICSISPAGIVVDANRAFQSIIGYPVVEITGEPIESFFLEKSRVEEILQSLIGGEDVRDEELNLMAKDGKKVPVSLSAAVRKDQEGNLTGYFMVPLDISQRKKFDEEMKRQVEERTKELQDKVKELEKINRLTVGRELKMIELKKEIRRLKEETESRNK